ncbi:hypothetical protein CBR_g32635 [Chara braunii]|uniref:fructose-bisphosphate aldolase n=1 Tax=Chara braunii TaxID=69332 RepID=A0A388LHF9_CHABU|nr:hypothetical protein CBR_g32635 [Chara braunii]|eukprot:GBG81642.1 hypothetical protein CBR_g32635 [Chara braunii]
MSPVRNCGPGLGSRSTHRRSSGTDRIAPVIPARWRYSRGSTTSAASEEEAPEVDAIIAEEEGCSGAHASKSPNLPMYAFETSRAMYCGVVRPWEKTIAQELGVDLTIMAHAGKYADELIATAKKIATPGRGILAADESTGTIGKRLASINVENVESNRRALRELLFTAPGAMQYISGVILALFEPRRGQPIDPSVYFEDPDSIFHDEFTMFQVLWEDVVFVALCDEEHDSVFFGYWNFVCLWSLLTIGLIHDPGGMTVDGRVARFKVNVAIDRAKVNWLKQHTVTIIFQEGARFLPKKVKDYIVRAYEDERVQNGNCEADMFHRGRVKIESANMVSYVAKNPIIALWMGDCGSSAGVQEELWRQGTTRRDPWKEEVMAQKRAMAGTSGLALRKGGQRREQRILRNLEELPIYRTGDSLRVFLRDLEEYAFRREWGDRGKIANVRGAGMYKRRIEGVVAGCTRWRVCKVRLWRDMGEFPRDDVEDDLRFDGTNLEDFVESLQLAAERGEWSEEEKRKQLIARSDKGEKEEVRGIVEGSRTWKRITAEFWIPYTQARQDETRKERLQKKGAIEGALPEFGKNSGGREQRGGSARGSARLTGFRLPLRCVLQRRRTATVSSVVDAAKQKGVSAVALVTLRRAAVPYFSGGGQTLQSGWNIRYTKLGGGGRCFSCWKSIMEGCDGDGRALLSTTEKTVVAAAAVTVVRRFQVERAVGRMKATLLRRRQRLLLQRVLDAPDYITTPETVVQLRATIG